MMQINDPAVVAELTDRHAAYEAALMANDVATLDALFWESPHAVRFGVTENLHGAEEIRVFRQGRPAINLARTILRLEILAVGDAAGIVNLEFERSMNGTKRHGRQTQFWFRFAEGWRIVSAHVSLLPEEPSYLDTAATQLSLSISAANREAVNQDLNRIGVMAKFLMEFPLSQDVEAAPVFHP